MTIVYTSPFLEGNFAPVSDEISVTGLAVLGELPADLNGIYLRNGPNPAFAPSGPYHWFDGDGMLHAVRIEAGRASYLNRYVRTEGLVLEQAAGRSLYSGLCAPPGSAGPKNPANTSLVYHCGRLLALWEGGAPHKINPYGLATDGLFDFDGDLFSAFTAHPKVDSETGEMMFFGYCLAGPPYLLYSIADLEGNLRTVPIDLSGPVVMHDFAITEDYTLFFHLPLSYSPGAQASGQPPFLFDEKAPSRFGIMPRYGDNKSIRWFEGPPCWIWHSMNAYEYGDEIVLTACRMDRDNLLTPARQSGGEAARLHRWRFNLASGALKEETLDDEPCEFPRINERLTGRQSRWGYAARLANPGAQAPFFSGLTKYDLASGRNETHRFGSGRFGGEAVFVPSASGRAEDDGYLLVLVFDYSEDRSELVVLNASDITASPLARVILPRRVPYGFHGLWLPEEQMKAASAN